MPYYLSNVTPTWVYPIEETYNVIVTETESLKKTFFLESTTPARRFRLEFSVTDGGFANILSHWRDVSGTFSPFYWTTVPSYINGGDGSGVSMYGRWVSKPSWTPKSKSWEVTMEFEKDI